MTKFLIDECVSQKAIRTVPTEAKNFDILLPGPGSYRGADDATVMKRASTEHRVLVSAEKDFGKFRLRPEDVPDGAIWLRPRRTTQAQIPELLAGLCQVLTREFGENPYDFHERIIEVFKDEVVVRTPGDVAMTFQV